MIAASSWSSPFVSKSWGATWFKHGLAIEGVKKVKDAKRLNLKGVHFHVGSQIEGTEAMIETTKLVVK